MTQTPDALSLVSPCCPRVTPIAYVRVWRLAHRPPPPFRIVVSLRDVFLEPYLVSAASARSGSPAGWSALTCSPSPPVSPPFPLPFWTLGRYRCSCLRLPLAVLVVVVAPFGRGSGRPCGSRARGPVTCPAWRAFPALFTACAPRFSRVAGHSMLARGWNGPSTLWEKRL